MGLYEVTVLETHRTTLLVEADDKRDTFARIKSGGGTVVDEDFLTYDAVEQVEQVTFDVSKVYRVFTEESLVDGEADEDGFIYQDERMTLDDVLRVVKQDGFTRWSSSVPNLYSWLDTPDPDIDYLTGNQTYYSLCITFGTAKQFEIVREAIDRVIRK